MTWRATIVSTLALLISVAWLWNPGHRPRFDWRDDDYAPRGFLAEMDGTAPKGICYRVFVPYLARAVDAVTPNVVRDRLAAVADRPPLSRMVLDRDMIPAYGAVLLIVVLSMLAVGFTLGPLGQLLCWASIGPSMGLCDPVTMATFSVAVWALWRKRERLFFAAFAVATTNRESAILLLVYYLFATKDWIRAAAAAGFYAAFRVVVADIYRDNSIQMCWYELERNVKLISPVRLSNLIPYAWGLWLAWHGRRALPRWMVSGFVVTAALWVPAVVLWSRPERLRSYLELMPVLALAVAAGLRRLSGDAGGALLAASFEDTMKWHRHDRRGGDQ